MTLTDYRDALRLLESAIALIESKQAHRRHLGKRLQRLSLEADLLRVRLRQAPARSQRN
jgi:hypothetical protein